MTVKLSPLFCDAQLDSSGNPASGYKLFTYTAGSSTKQTVYQDSAGITQHTNPILLNSRGEPPAPIWLTSGGAYKFIFTSPTDSDPPVSPIRTVDNVSGVNDTTSAFDEWVAGPTPTFVSATSLTFSGDQTTTFHVGRRLKTTNTAGTVYSTITASAFGALTTITVVNDSGTLDSGLSAVSYGLQAATNPSVPLLTDAYPVRSGSSDKTKKLAFEIDGFTTATTRTITIPDASTTMVGTDTAQTLTSKTLTAAVLGGTTNVSGGQLQFPAAQSASADANTLDDYEEGTWTPAIGGSATYTTQSGTYTKIGRVVHIEIRLTINAVGSGSTGVISGLPFTSSAQLKSLASGFWGAAAGSFMLVMGLVGASTTTINITGTTVAAPSITNTIAFFGNSADISLGGAYIV